MTKIRKQIFETNSSSSHSFSICPDKNYNPGKFIPDNEGKINIPTLEESDFPDKTNEPDLKASYLCLFLSVYNNPGTSEYNKKLNLIKKVISDFTGASEVIYEIDKDTNGIDHQSTDIIDVRDMTNPEFIKDFIFNPNSWLYVIWDSYDVDPDFYEESKKRSEPLYELVYNFPGIDETFTINLTGYDLSTITEYELNEKIEDSLNGIYYSTKENKFIKIKDNKEPQEIYRLNKINLLTSKESFVLFFCDSFTILNDNIDKAIKIYPKLIYKNE